MIARSWKALGVSVLVALLSVGTILETRAEESSWWSDVDDEALWPGLEPGPHVVGYRVEHLFDSTRSFPDTPEGAGPIQLSLWYPASSAEGHSAITWKDYLDSAATETDFSTPKSARRERHLEELRVAAVEAGADPERFRHLLGLQTLAFRDAPAAAGRYPLVVFVPGRGAPAFQNTVACEYLASNGFVVVSFPSVGAAGRTMTADEAGATAQVLDIEFAIKAARKFAPLDPEQVTIVGYSWGGLTAAFAAMRGAAVAAAVLIDPTLMVKKGHALARTLEGYDPAVLRMPVMLMIAAAQEWKERDLGFFAELPAGKASLLRFHDFKHGDFGSVIIRFFVHAQRDGGGRDVERINLGYATFCRYLLAFLNTHSGDDAEGQALLSEDPTDNGVPRGVVSIETR